MGFFLSLSPTPINPSNVFVFIEIIDPNEYSGHLRDMEDLTIFTAQHIRNYVGNLIRNIKSKIY